MKRRYPTVGRADRDTWDLASSVGVTAGDYGLPPSTDVLSSFGVIVYVSAALG